MHILLFIISSLYILVTYSTAFFLDSVANVWSGSDRSTNDRIIDTVTMILAPISVPIIMIYSMVTVLFD